ncbi:geranylgeranyl pyrophosphate synthase [Lasiosphaeria ovina]|uniref:Geranylgeranyl pyrophosphate synthase n=1 Tax=Lasiosphaeria ovina TaxID=92902 RepID=A0AAE0MXQ3_9PEZI|nr:geranylgeranyl pyrophosphate synthase [Lasiosphaeria ovina]
MELAFSSVVDPSLYNPHGLCDGGEVRLHNSHELGDLGSILAQKDWSENVEPCQYYAGTMSARFNVVSVGFPGCLPDRLEIVSYAAEIGFLVDDLAEYGDESKRTEVLGNMIDTFRLEGQRASRSSRASGKKRLLAKLSHRMLSIDRERAKKALNMWAGYLEGGGGGGTNVQFDTFEDFVEFRVADVGRHFTTGLMYFGMGITIPEHEEAAQQQLSHPAWAAISLTNDIFSREKEQRFLAQSSNKKMNTANAVDVLARLRSVGVDEAKEICRQEIIKYWNELQGNIEKAREAGCYSSDLLRFLESMKYLHTGGLVWSTSCPRYNVADDFSPRQREWMTNGIPSEVLATSVWNRTLPPSIPEPLVPERSLHSEETEANDSTDTKHILNGQEAVTVDGPKLNGRQSIEPYISSLPGKGVRNRVIDALNVWLQVPESAIKTIKRIIDLLYTASLMLDDIQDSSSLRRGKPATHTVFGLEQTVNSSSYKIAEALEEVLKLDSLECFRIVTEELKNLYIGQSLDLYLTSNLVCPTVEDGALIQMLARLLQATSPLQTKPDVDDLALILGRAYALRNDYMNLTSGEYADQKGFCEDLDEGKYSLPVIHALRALPAAKALVLRNMLTQRRVSGRCAPEHKQLVLDMLAQAGSLDYTLSALRLLQDQVDCEVGAVEEATGVDNYELRVIVEMMKV